MKRNRISGKLFPKSGVLMYPMQEIEGRQMSSSRIRCVAGIRRHVPRQRLTFQSPPQISTPMSLSLAIRYSAPDKGETCTRFATIPPIVFSSRCSSLFDRFDLEISSITISLDYHRSRKYFSLLFLNFLAPIFIYPFFIYSSDPDRYSKSIGTKY